MRDFPLVCGAAAIAIGAFTLLGWFLNRPEWTTFLPDLPSMVPNDGLMAMLGGVSLVVLAREGAANARILIGRAFAFAVLIFASLILFEHLFGADLGIDRALMDPGDALFHRPPGRPSPQATTAFALIAASLLLIDTTTRGGRRPSPVLAVLAALIPLIALLAYVFGTAELYGARALFPYIGMGIPTAIALLALSSGALAARAHEGLLSVLMRRDSGGLAARQLVAWLLILAAATCGIEAGARFGLYAAPIGSAGVVLLGIIGGSAFVLRVSQRLSRLDSEQRRRERDAALLSQVGGILTSSLDYEATLPMVAQLAVGTFADICVVEVAEDGTPRRLSAICRDPANAWVCDALMNPSLDGSRPLTIRRAIETKQLVAEEVSPEDFALPAHHELRRQLGASFGATASVLAVPLSAHARIVGAIAFVRTAPSTPYERRDFGVAEDLAQRAALSIDNGRLYHAAQDAIRARDDLMGVVAHDLRNPLSVILMQAEVLHLVHPNGGKEADESSAAISRSAMRMNRLIQDLLDVSRIEAGGLSVRRAAIDPAKLVAETVDSQRPLASSEKLDLQVDVPPSLPAIEGDRDRLMQVFENLIGNAIKFTDAGGRIRVGARPQNGDVVFWVSDTGMGMRQEDLPRVFDRFWRAEVGDKHGAGLGLPIVKGIVEAHGGHIWVESTVGNGTTFSFTIPAADESSTA